MFRLSWTILSSLMLVEKVFYFMNYFESMSTYFFGSNNDLVLKYFEAILLAWSYLSIFPTIIIISVIWDSFYYFMFFIQYNYDDMNMKQDNYKMMCANIATDIFHFLPPLFVLYST